MVGPLPILLADSRGHLGKKDSVLRALPEIVKARSQGGVRDARTRTAERLGIISLAEFS
jgi:hypothetical protein